MNINVNGVNRSSTAFVNVNGLWRESKTYTNINGIWRCMDKKQNIDLSQIDHFRIIYRPLKWMHYPFYGLKFNDDIKNVIDISGSDPYTINTDPKSLIYRFTDRDKHAEGIYCLEGIIYGVINDELIPLSNIMNDMDSPDDIDLKIDTSVETTSDGQFVLGWNRCFFYENEIPDLYIDNPTTENLIDAKIENNELIELYDENYKEPDLVISEDGSLHIILDSSPDIIERQELLSHYYLDTIVKGDLVLILRPDLSNEGYYNKIKYNGKQTILPSYKRSPEFDIISLIGIARSMKSHYHNMIGTQGTLVHNWYGIFLNNKQYPFSVEYLP